MERRDWTLLVVCAARGEPLSPVQLQKILFLLGERRRPYVGRNYYNFIPHNFGPFDRLVYVDAERLAAQQFITIDRPSGKRWDEYTATLAGLAVAERVREEAPVAAVTYIDELVTWARNRTFEQLVSAIYEEYPAMRQNSIFRGQPQGPAVTLRHTPEGDAEQQQRSRAADIRERTLQDPDMLEVLEEARRRREGGEGEWVTPEELDARYPAQI
jgi:hypothetical protein